MRYRFVSLFAALLLPLTVHAATGLALYGTPKYPEHFTHFDYVNPQAPKGGTFRLSYNANFDSVNPYILKGLAAPGLGDYLYQTLMTPSYDEPQSYYALVADSVTLSADRLHATFHLNPKARWHDGEPITAEDVVFSLETLKAKGHPSYRVLYKPITVKKIDAHTIEFTFADAAQHELPVIAASLPVLPKHYFEKVPFDKTTLTPPLGSGPYKVSEIDPGRRITYTRVKDYWGTNLPSQRGRFNFDTITFDVYRDDVVALEGIKSHQFDFYEEFIARNWATAYDIPAVKSGQLIKTRIPHSIPRGMQGFIFNTRLPKFSDPRLREAIGLTMDFEWMNKALFYGAYERNHSYFNHTEFEAKGLPSKEELSLLNPYRDELPPALFTTPFTVPSTDGSGYPRENLIRAQALLDDAGWVMRDGARVNEKTGEPFTIEFLMTQRTFERVVGVMRRNLAKLGIKATFRYVDASQYQKRLDHRQFDIVSIWWNQGVFYPGSEQYMFWHSSQADIEGSQNVGGVKNAAVDRLVERIRSAQSLDQLRPAGRALDRVLLNEYYVIPHWNINAWRVAYWQGFARPKITGDYNLGLDTWWQAAPIDNKKAGAK
jgi:microcin C transport system substrate-binding protein